MNTESLEWLDSIGFDYDRSLADAMLSAAGDWTVVESRLESRRSATLSTHPGLEELRKAEKLEFIEAVALVCADRKYFPNKRELWLQEADVWEKKLLDAIAECESRRFANPSVDDAEIDEELTDWKDSMKSLWDDLEAFCLEMDHLFPRKMNDAERALHKCALPRRAELARLQRELKKEFQIVTGEKRRRPLLIKIGVGILVVTGIIVWRVLKWSRQ